MPTAQATISLAPGGHQLPGEQGVHVEILTAREAALTVPAGHGTTLGEPSGQKPPGKQSMQSVEFVLGWYRPAGHLAHSSMPLALAKVPTLHIVGSYTPRAQALP